MLTFEDAPPANPSSPSGLPVIVLAAVGCVAAFFGASELTSHGFLDAETTLPLLGGLAAIIALVVYQYRAKRPLLTIRTMLTSSIPVAGIVVALFAAAASVSATALTAGVLAARYSPVHVGLLYLPEVGGAVVSAVALGLVIRRRAMHYLPLAGMILLAAGIVVFRIEVPSSQALTLVGSGLTGLGLGATVAPALFVAGFSLPAFNLQRVFAIVELFRAVAAFMVAPIFAHLAATAAGNLDAGTGIALWIGLGLAVIGGRRRRRHLRAQRCPPPGARPRPLPGGHSASVVLAAAAGKSSLPARPPAPSNRKGRLTWQRTDVAAAEAVAGPVLFAYDGSELAAFAIEQAGKELATGREALVLCVWQPADVGFVLTAERRFDADQASQVQTAAEEVAANGAQRWRTGLGSGHRAWRSRPLRPGKGSSRRPRSTR